MAIITCAMVLNLSSQTFPKIRRRMESHTAAFFCFVRSPFRAFHLPDQGQADLSRKTLLIPASSESSPPWL